MLYNLPLNTSTGELLALLAAQAEQAEQGMVRGKKVAINMKLYICERGQSKSSI